MTSQRRCGRWLASRDLAREDNLLTASSPGRRILIWEKVEACRSEREWSRRKIDPSSSSLGGFRPRVEDFLAIVDGLQLSWARTIRITSRRRRRLLLPVLPARVVSTRTIADQHVNHTSFRPKTLVRSLRSHRKSEYAQHLHQPGRLHRLLRLWVVFYVAIEVHSASPYRLAFCT